MNTTISDFRGTRPGQRIHCIDLLRGFALLGILVMNIQSFSMISHAYMNPMAYGNMSGINKWVWILSHVLAAEKFMSLFSMLFGAGMLLFLEHASQKGLNTGALHFRRMFWLFIFGMAHAYLIWYGDILVAYSIAAVFVYLFRRMRPVKLIVLASFLFMVPVLFNLFFGLTFHMWPEASQAETANNWLPVPESIQTELDHMRGSWLEQMKSRVPQAKMLQTFIFLVFMFWRVSAMMLFGMALYKLGVITSKKSNRYYLRMAIAGSLIGLPLISWGVWMNFSNYWKVDFSMFLGAIPNYLGSFALALAYMGLIMLWSKSKMGARLKSILEAVGRMAFTNYIMTSLIATFVFYGHGLGWFGYMERLDQIWVVFAIWAIILTISPLWLKSFYFGPLEWLWRSLTYGKWAPFKRKAT